MPTNDVKVPVLGKTPKGGVLAGLLAVVGVGGYLVYKHYIAAKAPPAGTGYGYGGYGTAYGYGASFGYGYVPPTGFAGGGGGYPFPYGYGGGGTPGPTTITTNSQWFQAALGDLGSTGGDHSGRVLASYLFGLPVQEADQQIIMEAEAFEGPPPVAGLGGYPPKIHLIGGKHKPPPPGGKQTTTITIHRTQTLRQLAASRGWNAQFLAEVEKMTRLGPNSTVHKGQHLTIPRGDVTP
jgi:hypothetical protein